MGKDLRCVVLGRGEVGKPLYELVRGVYPESESFDPQYDDGCPSGPFDVIHVCYPRSGHFVSDSADYARDLLSSSSESPGLLIIESTVPVGTTRRIWSRLDGDVGVVHSPARGMKREGMKQGLLKYTKFIGPVTSASGVAAKEYYRSLGVRARICAGPEVTELAKLANLSYYALMIGWFQELRRMTSGVGSRPAEEQLAFEQVCDFLASTEKEGGHPRPVMRPGVIRGHCVIPGVDMLKECYPSKFLDAVLDSNERVEEDV